MEPGCCNVSWRNETGSAAPPNDEIRFFRILRNVYRYGFLLGFICISLACAHPFEISQPVAPDKTVENHPLLFLYRGPLNHLSAVRYGQCPMYPSCSEYTKQSFEKHGFLKGAVMMFDRLIRCGRNELDVSPLIYIDGDLKCFDPVNRSGGPGESGNPS